MCALGGSRPRRSRITKLFAGLFVPWCMTPTCEADSPARGSVPVARLGFAGSIDVYCTQDAYRMRALFVHQNFPAQYRHVAPALARRPGTPGDRAGRECRGGAARRAAPVATSRRPPAAGETHRYLRRLENAIFRGQQVARAALVLKERGFSPGLRLLPSRLGGGAVPARCLAGTRGCCSTTNTTTPRPAAMSASTRPGAPVEIDDACRVRMLNANHLLCLQVSDWGHTADALAGQPLPRLGAAAPLGGA